MQSVSARRLHRKIGEGELPGNLLFLDSDKQLYHATGLFLSLIHISVSLNGKKLNRLWITHNEIVKGGVLEFDMGPKPTAMDELVF